MMRSGWSRSAAVGALILGWVGCGGARDELDSERGAWEQVRPSHYQFDYTETGYLPGGGPWRIEVSGDQVVSVTFAGEGGPPAWVYTEENAPTIDALFDEVARTLDTSSVKVTVSYDPRWHHPSRMFVHTREEGSGFRAEALTPLE